MHLAPSLRCIWLKIYIITAHGTSWNIYCWYEAIHSRNWNPHVYDKTEWFLFLFSLVFGFHNPFQDHKASFSMASTGISSSLPGAPKGSGKHQSSEVTEIDCLKCLKCLKWLNCEKKWIAHHESHMPPSSIQSKSLHDFVGGTTGSHLPIFAFVHQPLGLKFSSQGERWWSSLFSPRSQAKPHVDRSKAMDFRWIFHIWEERMNIHNYQLFCCEH